MVDEYDGTVDAEVILEQVMCRKNWSITVRDELAEKLTQVRRKRPLGVRKIRRRPETTPMRNKL